MPVQERYEAYMSVPELVKALRRIRTMDELRCFGCGHEHNCSIHGCTIIRQAVDVIETLYGYFAEMMPCEACVHGHGCPEDVIDCVGCANDHRRNCPCLGCSEAGSKWVWRGPEKEENNEATDNR